MPLSGDQQLDPNQPRYGLPLDSCVGDDGPTPEQVTVISVGGGKASGASFQAPSGGDPYAGGQSAGKAGAQGGPIPTIVSGPVLPDDRDTDDPNRS